MPGSPARHLLSPQTGSGQVPAGAIGAYCHREAVTEVHMTGDAELANRSRVR